MDRGIGLPHAVFERVPRRNLARLRRRRAQGPVGSGKESWPVVRATTAPHRVATSRAHRHRANRRLHGASHQRHRARLDHRLRRNHQNRRNDRQRHLPALPRLQLRRALLLRAVLPAVVVEQAAGT